MELCSMNSFELITAGLICAEHFKTRSDARIIEAHSNEPYLISVYEAEPNYIAFGVRALNAYPQRLKERRYVVYLEHFANRKGTHFYAGYQAEENVLVIYIPDDRRENGNGSWR